jgi:hypothetical protein
VAAASRFVPLCEAACRQSGVAQSIGTVLPLVRQAPQACDCETPFRFVDILRALADAARAHLTVGTAMISGRSPVCLTRARFGQRPGRRQNSPCRFAIFWPLLFACLALLAADVAWACQSPDRAQLPSQANLLADEALDPKGVASPSDAAFPAAERTPNSSCPVCRCLRPGSERLGATKLRAEGANLARAPPSCGIPSATFLCLCETRAQRYLSTARSSVVLCRAEHPENKTHRARLGLWRRSLSDV